MLSLQSYCTIRSSGGPQPRCRCPTSDAAPGSDARVADIASGEYAGPRAAVGPNERGSQPAVADRYHLALAAAASEEVLRSALPAPRPRLRSRLSHERSTNELAHSVQLEPAQADLA